MSIIRGEWTGQVRLDFWYDDEAPGMDFPFDELEESVKTRYKKYLLDCIEKEQGENVTVTVTQLCADLYRDDKKRSKDNEKMRRFTTQKNGIYITLFDKGDTDEERKWVYTTQAAIDRLAAYENTGLKPEDISDLITEKNVLSDCNGNYVEEEK